MLQGNLGYSHLWRTPVNMFIWDRLRNTTVLAFIAFAIIAPLSVVFGVVAGMREGSILDRTYLGVQHDHARPYRNSPPASFS